MQALQQQLGRRIRQIREKKGLSQEALAGICSLHRTYIGLIERGERNLSINTVEVVARGLGVSPAELFAGIDAPTTATARVQTTKAPAATRSEVDAHLATIQQILIDAKLTTQRDYQSLFEKHQKNKA